MINKVTLRKIISAVFDKGLNYSSLSFSQEGEDLILNTLMGERNKGFYIDAGSYHPFKFSNTYFFYKKGWRGINIDATPSSMNLFRRYRTRDINIECAVSDNKKSLNYYIFDEPALNSVSKKLSINRNRNTKYKIKRTVKIKPKKLSEILNKYLPRDKTIDFMNIDVEGSELGVLRSNNWSKYAPEYILVEILDFNLEAVRKSKIYFFLKNKGYELITFTGRTAIFRKI